MSTPVDHPPPLCPSCTARMEQAAADGMVGIMVCGDCQAREAAREAATKAARLASLRTPAVPWSWDSNCGEWGLWDAAGNPLVMEYHFVEGNLDPYVEAMTSAAPELEKFLIRALYETQPNGVCRDIHETDDWRQRAQALLDGIAAARKAGG